MTAVTTATPIFEAKNIVMDFTVQKSGGMFAGTKTLRALNDVSFQMFPGESLAVVGESGCGKSTLCRIAMRVYEPTGGRMTYAGKDVHNFANKQDYRNYREKVQMIFQDPFSSLNPLHSIEYTLSRPLKLYHGMKNKQELDARINEIMETVGLIPAVEQKKKYPHQLSGGQKQRAFIGKVLAIGADVVFADEPTSMLDVSIRLGVLNLMNKMKFENKKSFLYITHDIATARYFSERIIVLYCGHMVEWGDVNKIVKEPAHPYTQLLISAAPDPERDGLVELKEKGRSEIQQWTPESKGCPFAPRCLRATQLCYEQMPEAVEVDPGRFVRCNHL